MRMMNHFLSSKTFSTSQRGFTLLELLLVVGVTSLLFVGISQITRSWINAEVAENAGQHMERVGSIVEKYIQANWNTLGGNQTDILVAGQTPGSPWEDLVTRLDQEGLLVAGALRSPIGVPMRISYMQTVIGTEQLYRATIMSTDTVANEQALSIARKSGTYGGTISDFTGTNTAASAYGQWVIATNELTPGVFPCTPTTRRSCIVATVAYSEESLRGPYLYRSLINGDPEFNTMRTDLRMNNNNIENAALISTDNMDVANNASLGTTTVNGAAVLNSGADVTGAMNVSGNTNIIGNMNVDGNMDINGGSLTTPQLNTPFLQTDTISTTRMSADNINVQGEMLVRDNLIVQGDLRADNTISATEMNIGDATVAGEIRSGSVDISNTMTITGTVNMTGGGDFIADRLVTDGCVSIRQGDGSYENYGVCP